MILELKQDPFDYYKHIKNIFPDTYMTEDNEQIIIGIDCDYYDSENYTYSDIRSLIASKKGLSDFSGLFGVFSYETIHYFEKIKEIDKAQYFFPKFIFSDAKAYLHYDKYKSVFSFFGNSEKYLIPIKKLGKNTENNTEKRKVTAAVITDIKKEEKLFKENIEKAKEYIRNGDIFQVVLSSQLLIESNLDPLDFYKKLSLQNPSPYMFYFPTPYGDVVGSSPEILLKVEDNKILTAPIAGTRPRGKNENEDKILAEDLLNDEKELAEHKMLIDLARNDISKFSIPGSTTVKNPMHIEYFQHVMHIGSEVYSIKKDNADIFDIISTAFPAGTLSGAPKIRAMEIIAELEEYKRNIYGGGIGFIHYNGNSQIAIIIRTAFYNKNQYFIQSGAGIVYDSIPENEYQEIKQKRKSLTGIFKDLLLSKEETI